MNSTNLSRSRDLGGIEIQAVKLEQNGGRSVLDKDSSPVDNSSFCSTSSICPAPICRQFWQAGNYIDKLTSKPTIQNGTGYLHMHPKFLHTNATSHKWAFGAMAELLDNAVDEIQNGATFVIVDKTLNPRDGTPALLVQDDGGGMSPDAMRRCISFGFSDKNLKTAIGQYGNGFKTSSMRLGADVVVFSRCMRDRKLTQSVGLLSYTFLMQTRQDRILVPMVDYQFDAQSCTWSSLHSEDHHHNNLSILLQWSPVTTEAELLKQCDDVGSHGTRVIVYNLWHNDEGKMELDFESDPEDICLSGTSSNTAKASSRRGVHERHLANRIHCSLRAYLSILYLRVPENFHIFLRGQAVAYHNIANDLKFPQFILYRPQNVEGSVITAIGFLKEAPAVNIHGFNVYHKNRLILPFWHVVSYAGNRGRGVVGVLEANFMEPTHNKQDFEKTTVFQRLEARLKDMTQEYWDIHCGLIGYQQIKSRPTPIPEIAPSSREVRGIYQPVSLVRDFSCAIGAKAPPTVDASQRRQNMTSKFEIYASSLRQGAQSLLRRKMDDHSVESERPKRVRTTSGFVQHAVDPAKQLKEQEASKFIRENKILLAQCQEFEKIDKELNLKISRLREEVIEANREYARLQVESKFLDKVKQEHGRLKAA